MKEYIKYLIVTTVGGTVGMLISLLFVKLTHLTGLYAPAFAGFGFTVLGIIGSNIILYRRI